ncbi:uncharacterized protein K452DRAFT_273808 [Aplosporella prunicola CBS 121167]|uniref:Putative gamma-glutamylcyclotransferase n=1 Tax=Aplosporella prunicola CBS 121167 TaxID=1176127 RepID=A0A6A6B7Y7_9PEZI|nr:uncharacterized protein K452DRAFT_273808 [Aplosporella prunicola CBS 121167]KAF2140200.1 hypothetical protein K452DRAFT_273808 [Aplosporella prunicola CBS 121167]
MGDHKAFFYGTRQCPKPSAPACLTPPSTTGTLMAPAVLHRVCHGTPTPNDFQKSLLTARPALLPSYRRHKVRFADYPAILPDVDPAACVRGTFVTGLTDGDIWRLDLFEGSEYKRERVRVKVLAADGGIDAAGVAHHDTKETGEEVEVETYVWIAGKHKLEDEEWDFDEFVREKIGRWVGRGANEEYAGTSLTSTYTEVDDAVAAQGHDPTGGRAGDGWR